MKATTWISDPAHSELQFKIKHLMISTVTGQVQKFEIRADADDNDFSKAKIRFSGDVDSIDTNNEQRDTHLRSPDFFDSAQYPGICFESTKMDRVDEEHYTLQGDLTIKDTTRSVLLDVEFGGITEDRFGNTKAGFTISAKIKRHDFGVGPVNPGLGDEIKLYGSFQMIKQE